MKDPSIKFIMSIAAIYILNVIYFICCLNGSLSHFTCAVNIAHVVNIVNGIVSHFPCALIVVSDLTSMNSFEV